MRDVVSTELHHFLVVKIPTLNITLAVPYNRPEGDTSAFLRDLESLCLDMPNCILMGDLNLDQVDIRKHNKLMNLLETHGFGLLNEISEAAVTRRESGTILDIIASNMLRYRYKISLVHHASSDHAIVYTSINRNQQLPSNLCNRKKFHLTSAIEKVNEICGKNEMQNGNELNVALEKIVGECTETTVISSNYRIKKSHVNKDLILAVRERDRLLSLKDLYPHNIHIAQKYLEKKTYVETTNEYLRANYNANRLSEAAGDDRKTWRLYREIVFNQHQNQQDHTITINGNPSNGSNDACNEINNHFCSAGEHLAATIVSIHGYEIEDIDNLYPQYANNNWSFKEVNSNDVATAIKNAPNKKTTGIDNVPISLLKSTSTAISPIIALCFNLALRIAVFPYELLKGRLKLIHKSGDSNINNFRGLTLLPVLSKIFEYLLANQLTEYLNSINFF